MNAKVFIGFIAGALAASVGSYLVVHRQPQVAPQLVSVTPAPALPQEETPATPAERRLKSPVKHHRVASSPPVPIVAENIPAKAPQDPPPSAPPPEPAAPPSVESAPPPPPAPAAPAAAVPEPPHTITIAAGALISVRLGDALSSRRNKPGDVFSATLDQPLIVDGFVIAERGARAEGRIAEVDEAGRVKGLARLSIELTSLSTSDGQKVPIRTAQFEKTGPTESRGEDAAKIGVGAVLGTIIGAAAGGGKGAAIGAAAGGAAGTGTAVATRRKPAELPVETHVSFKLDQPVTITEHR